MGIRNVDSLISSRRSDGAEALKECWGALVCRRADGVGGVGATVIIIASEGRKSEGFVCIVVL